MAERYEYISKRPCPVCKGEQCVKAIYDSTMCSWTPLLCDKCGAYRECSYVNERLWHEDKQKWEILWVGYEEIGYKVGDFLD
jgi:hypothetical protein